MTTSIATNEFGNIVEWTNADPQSLPAESAAQTTSIVNAFNSVSTNRAIKSYKWANASARTSQTGMSEGDIGDQADTDQLWRYNGTAWIPASNTPRMVPSSIAFSGTSATITSSGRVDFTSCTVVTIKGCFALTISENYDIEINATSASSSGVSINLLSGSTVESSGNYDIITSAYNGSTSSSGSQLLGTSWPVSPVNNILHEQILNLKHVNNSSLKTVALLDSASGSATPTYNSEKATLVHRLLAAYDGIQYTFSSAASGSVRIMGRGL